MHKDKQGASENIQIVNKTACADYKSLTDQHGLSKKSKNAKQPFEQFEA